jgi:hypothetical protein
MSSQRALEGGRSIKVDDLQLGGSGLALISPERE